ncbi:hypothetical protein R5W24_001207 [Gemmata sp. JC717]|uniref:hypothetical protein n=1 Tax=Gemmata algarum TaxID=2975278 RepID=UPI0021BA64BF|nr:hypothetical protein [Gemmata algarum]MDY3552127.1 hypothetical protein [Gemmata algarum]
MRTRFSAAAGAVALLLFFSGCGDKVSEVSGTVTFDGKAVANGDIIFESPDGSVTPAAGKIANGQYSLAVAPGPKKVRITAPKPPTKPDPVMGMNPIESLIPKEYNVETKLTADLKPGKREGLNFDLKAKP